ncbi:hypothetical protein GCM10007940_20600 [Portibacter lacus]|uniref:DUF4296 domain-containing protein n=1 Tax=Portibacter lacus TaxID=1099794 RepID=A0AA37WFY8_9BACT|nr:hypothetical protein GCM10007940_20600 [Portibacter lacus]
MTDEELATIVADMHITENAIGRHDLSLRDSLSVIYLEKLEEIHGISKEEMKREVELMMDNPKRQSEIYGIVIRRLQAIEKEVKEENKSKDKD